MMTQVYLGLGANIDPQTSLQAGVAELRKQFGAINLSPVYLAPAVGINGPDFLNMVVGFACPMNHNELMAWIRRVEAKHGRVRPAAAHHKPASHGLDMDVLLFGELVDSALKVPRPDILTCAYVLQPLADLAPNLVHPCSGQSMAQLQAACSHKQLLTRVDLSF
ncbi:MAG TPA: 2-amino-4-hydroxy-6-hydroxymethyldihydropteridine diphosphokinase [Oceanospirillaceae bacterium]|nr:2-amino-4-hydroxy-6-hydroxymethyldihydropteridine diphosphokinase [Oceanospirillaceae bacterium]